MSVPPPEPGGKPIHLDDVLARLRSSLARSSDPHLALITNNGARVRPQQGGSFADAIAAKAPQISDALITGPRPHLSPEVTSSIPAVQKPFHHLAALGYDRLLPIIPPDGNLSPRSHLKRRIGGKVGPRGKMPGVRREDGWVGLGSWSKTRANVADLDAWHAMGAGVGLMTGNGLVAIDIDALDETTADRIERDAIEILGFAPMRVGRWPKRLLLYRTTDEIPFRKLMFRGIDGGAERVELSTGGRQCVVSGIHPGTGRPYEWRRPLVPFEALSIVDAGQLDAFFARLASWLPGATTSGTREAPTDRATVDQAALKGDLALIRSAVEATPNRSRDFDYDGWVKYAAALRGACRDSVDLGRELFVAFSERSDIVEPEEDPIHTYDGLTPPFAVGAEHIFRQAERLAGWTGRRDRNTTTWFDNDAASRIVEGPNRGLTVNDLERRRITPTPFTFTDPAAIPPRAWIYGDHLIRQHVSATVAPGGLGKSSLSVVEALAMVSGKPLLGIAVRRPVRVWIWNGEDPHEELQRRVAAAMLFFKLTPDDVGDRLFFDSGRDQPIKIANQDRDAARIMGRTSTELISALSDRQIDVLILDPFVSLHAVNENDNGAIDAVVGELASVAGITNTAVEVIHHVRKRNGPQTEIGPDDARGAGALINRTRSTRTLTRMTAEEAKRYGVAEDRFPRLFRCGDGKRNLTPPRPNERTEWFELRSQQLGNVAVDPDGAIRPGDEVGVVALAALDRAGSTPDQRAQLQAGLADLERGEWRYSERSESWIGIKVAAVLGIDPADKPQLRAIVKEAFDDQLLAIELCRDRHRNLRPFITLGANFLPLSSSVFG